MSDLENRLVRCFTSVFYWLTPDEIYGLHADSSENWDSLSSVTVAAVIQEEFGMEIDSEILPSLNSFESFRKYLSDARANDTGGQV